MKEKSNRIILQDKVFKLMWVVLGVALIGIAYLFWEEQIEGSVVLCVIAFYLFSYSEGIEIDLEKQQIRKYKKHFWIGTGSWMLTSTFQYISILSLKGKNTIGAGSVGLLSVTTSGKMYDVYFLNENHLRKSYIHRFKSYEKAFAFAKKLSDRLELPLVKFSPKISEESMEMKMRRRR